MKCSNNIKQIALSLRNYHDAVGVLPPGQPQGFYYSNWYSDPMVKNWDRSCWIAHTLPGLEQTAMATQMAAWITANSKYTHFGPFATTHLTVMLCPSDANSPKLGTVPGEMQGTHANYVTCLGNGYAAPGGTNGLNLNGIFYGRSRTKLVDITDGISNTVMLSELLVSPDVGSSHDVRVRIWNSIHAGSEFSTIYPPNSTVGDNVMGYCQPIPGAPCGTQSISNAFTLARSRHTGGVNAGMADGSVRFVTNGITPSTWLGLGTRARGRGRAGELKQ